MHLRREERRVQDVALAPVQLCVVKVVGAPVVGARSMCM